MVNSPYVVGISAYGIFSVTSNGNGSMCKISTRNIIICFPYIGNTLHAYILNEIPHIHFSYVYKPVAFIH